MFGIITSIFAIATKVVSAIAPILPTIAKGANAILSALPKIAGAAIQTISKIGAAVFNFAKSVGVMLEKFGDVAEVGYVLKTASENQMKPQDGEPMESFIGRAREQYPFDSIAFNNMKEEEQLSCYALGTSAVLKSVEEKIGLELSPEFQNVLVKIEADQQAIEAEMSNLINGFKEEGMKSMDPLVSYLKNDHRIDSSTIDKVDNILFSKLQETYPDKTPGQIDTRIIEMEKAIK